MSQQRRHGFKALQRGPGRARGIEYQTFAEDAAATSREGAEGTGCAHQFRESGRIAFDHRRGCLRGEVSRRKPSSTGRHDEPGESHGEFAQRRRHLLDTVGHETLFDDLVTCFDQSARHCRARAIDTLPHARRVRDRQDLRAQRHVSSVDACGRDTPRECGGLRGVAMVMHDDSVIKRTSR